jgi:hypothetical protein
VVVLLSVTLVVPPGVSGFGEKLTVVPDGFPLALRLIGVLNPPFAVVLRLRDMLEPAGQEEVAAAGGVNVNPNGTSIVKFVLEMSKNTLPIASTLILAVVVGVEGTVMVSDPSLGVLANSTVGKV